MSIKVGRLYSPDMSVNILNVECSKCRVSKTCPRFGSSPVIFDGKKIMCSLVGGYGRTPINAEDLSPESLEKSKTDGPCLTFALIPTIKEDGSMRLELVKIFNHPVLHERETIR
jgi:hypothetical protein